MSYFLIDFKDAYFQFIWNQGSPTASLSKGCVSAPNLMLWTVNSFSGLHQSFHTGVDMGTAKGTWKNGW